MHSTGRSKDLAKPASVGKTCGSQHVVYDQTK